MYRIVILVAILSAAMLAGLMGSLLVVFRPMWNRQTDEAASISFQQFLAVAATNRVLSTLSILPVVCGIVIIFLNAPSATKPVYAIIGGGIFLVGFFLWTAFFNLPIYRAVSAWNRDGHNPGSRQLIKRFHRVNTVRFAAALATSVLFFLAG